MKYTRTDSLAFETIILLNDVAMLENFHNFYVICE